MRRSWLILAFCLFSASGTRAWAGEPVSLSAADGVRVFGELNHAEGKPRAMVLLFHMAGSNRGEYAEIAPRLAALGFDSLAIDQRSGGSAWGRANETVRNLGRSTDYLPALADLEAALAYAVARKPALPVVVWGSSYSAALVFLLAARHPAEVSALLAFSPGEYLGGASVEASAAKVRAPSFVTSASDPGEISAAAALLAAEPATFKRQFKPQAGVHGSSTLRAGDNPAGWRANWEAVEAFLKVAAPG